MYGLSSFNLSIQVWGTTSPPPPPPANTSLDVPEGMVLDTMKVNWSNLLSTDEHSGSPLKNFYREQQEEVVSRPVVSVPWYAPSFIDDEILVGGGPDPNLYFVLGIGQSNWNGLTGTLIPYVGSSPGTHKAITNAATTYGYMLQTGVIPGQVNTTPPSFPDASLIPLRNVFEGIDSFDSPVHGESQASSLLRYLQTKHPGKNFGVTSCALDGTGIVNLTSGTNPYAWGTLAVKAMNSQASVLNAGGKAICIGLIYIGGETDAQIGAAKCTVASGSNGVAFPLVNATISTSAFTVSGIPQTGFVGTGGTIIIQSTVGPQLITYTSCTSGQFVGCNGGFSTGATGLTGGVMQTGGRIINAVYAQLLKAFAADWVTTIQGITTQNLSVNPIPCLYRQQFLNAVGEATSGSNSGMTAFQDYVLWINEVLTGGTKTLIRTNPDYYLLGCSGATGHRNAWSQIQFGEKHGEVLDNTVYGANNWDCVRPTNISRVTDVITLTLQTPRGTGYYNAYSMRAATNMGLSYADSGGTIGISSVVFASVTSSQIVLTVTLTGDPTANTLRVIRSAWVGDTATSSIGKVTQARTNIWAVDTGVSSNYGVTVPGYLDDVLMCFEEAVP